ncbi:MAG: hypothetical protein PVF33_00300 [Candidatus Latescibacterota bacterium]
MKKKSVGQLFLLLAFAAAGLLIAAGCSDDDNPVDNGGGGGGQTYSSPNGEYDITSSNVSVTIVDSNVPAALLPYIEQFIQDVIDNGGTSDADISQDVLLLLKTESEVCLSVPYVYNEDTRSCTTETPIDVQDYDVSSLGLCETIPGEGEHCIDTVSLTANFIPDLVWPSSFATFSGSEAVGSVGDPAEMTVVVSGSLGGTFFIDFYASRNLSGTRCTDCATCSTGPVGPSPNGDWNVTSTGVNVTVIDSDLPSEFNSIIADWIADAISNGGSSVWTVAQASLVLSRTETDMCAPMVYVYNPVSRRCNVPTPVDVSDVDVSALNICQDNIVVGQHCLKTISLTADFTPNLQWAPDFDSFDGTEQIGSQANTASATVTISGTVGGTFNVDFYSSRNVSGTRCTGCTTCD